MFNLKKIIKKDEYISLLEASEICDYSQEYLSLRARQGKFKAVKVGRNWVTTKEWLEEYIKTTKRNKKEDSVKTKGSSLKIKFALSFCLALILFLSLFFMFGGEIKEATKKTINKTNIVLNDSSYFIRNRLQDISLIVNSKISSDSFSFQLISNVSTIFKENSEDILFSVYENIYKFDESILSFKKDTSNKFSNIKRDFDSGFSSFFKGNEVNLGKNVKGGFISSIITAKSFLFKKDSLANIKSKEYQDKLNIPDVMKATVTTFIDYGDWLSNQSKIFKTLKDY